MPVMTAAPLPVTIEQRRELERLARSSSAPHRSVVQAKALLLAADGVANEAIARECSTTPDTVRRWRTKFAAGGVGAVGSIAPGRGRKPEIPQAVVDAIVDDTLHTVPDDDSSCWSTRTMGQRHGVGKDTVARIWRARQLRPWRVDTFKLSNDPRFEEKLVDVVGLYLDPPERAAVFCFDEKTQCQALDRTQPSLPMKPGRASTMTHDYKRNGTLDLFAALNVGTGEILHQTRKQHTAVDVLAFFKWIDLHVPADLEVHVVLDNLSAHSAPPVAEWLAHPRRKRWHLHFTPTSASWLNLVEGWFAQLTNRRLKRAASTASGRWPRPSTPGPHTGTTIPSPSCGTPPPAPSSTRSSGAGLHWPTRSNPRRTTSPTEPAFATARAPAEARAQGVSALTEADIFGKPVHNALVWQDTRTDTICNQLSAKGGQDRFRDTTGLPIATYFSGPKIKWLLDIVEGVREKAEAGDVLFGNIDTWLIWNLTGGPDGGAHVIDVSNASRTMMMDLHTLDWDLEILSILGVPRAMLPTIRASSEIYGEARESALLGIPVAGDLGDQQAALFGQTCFSVGEAKNTYGTGNFLLLNTGHQAVPSTSGLLTTLGYRIGDQEAVCSAMAT